MLKKDQAAGPGLFKNLALFLFGGVDLGCHRRLFGFACSGRCAGGSRCVDKRGRGRIIWVLVCGIVACSWGSSGALVICPVAFDETTMGAELEIAEANRALARFEDGLPHTYFCRQTLVNLVRAADNALGL